MQIAWRPQMAVDHGMIDKDHWTLLQIISEFTDIKGDLPGADVLGGILLKLDHYAKVHFEREQWLQQKIGYPYADAHEHEHRDLTKRLDVMREKFKADGTQGEIAVMRRRNSAFGPDHRRCHVEFLLLAADQHHLGAVLC